GRGRHTGQQRSAVALAAALIIAEDERLVLLDGRARRSAELVPEGYRNESAAGAGNRIGLREGIAGLSVLVAAIPEAAAVQLIGAGFGLCRNDRLAGLAELGVVRRGGNLQLRNSVKIRCDYRLAQHRFAIVRAVQLEVDAAPILAADRGPVDVLRLFA